MKTRLHTVVFAVTLTVSVGLMVAGFIVPPTGVIDGSVLTGVGELFAFAALSQLPFVIRSGKGITLNHGNTSISVNGKTNAQPPDNDPDNEDQDPC